MTDAGATRGTASPAAAGDPDAHRLLGQVISDRYRIDELIGEGGMGAVYSATHTHMRKRLAVKVLHPAMLGHREAVERFEREAIAGAHIEHPNVATATDFGKLEDGSHFLVLELLEGEDLRTVVGRGPLGPERTVKVARQIGLALRAAHQLGIIHRDLKPENIMLVRRDRDSDVVKVLDFGIAKVPVDDLAATRGSSSAAALTQMGMVYGTPEYMAPEQALGEEIDGRADLYALGVMMYEMLCGYRPFDADNRVVLLGLVATKRPPRLAERVPGTVVPREIEDIVMRLLDKDAKERFADADAFLEALEIAILELDYSLSPTGGLPARLGSSADRSGPYPPLSTSAADRASGSPEASRDAALRVGTGARAETVASQPGLSPAPMRGRTGLPSRSLAEAAPARSALPPLALLAGFGLVAIGAAVAAAVMLRGDDAVAALEGASAGSAVVAPGSGAPATPSGAATSAPGITPEPPRPADGVATMAELEAARSGGLTALGPLAQRYPNDPAVLKALLLAHAGSSGGYGAAMGVARHLFGVSPEATADEDVRRVILRTANAQPAAAAAAFDVMSQHMGSRGPDLLYELLIAPGIGKFPKDRAEKLLKDDRVKKQATPALLVANDLRAANGCGRKRLFARATEVGDGRSLPHLKPLALTNACRPSGIFGRLSGDRLDCYPCLGSRAELRAAIEAIEGRITTQGSETR